jgi:BlaI family penicillinase repressor
MKKLTPKEEEIMNILWTHGPLFIREMLAFYSEPKPHYNTVATLVKLLVEKGFVSYRAFGNTYRYEAKITGNEYKGSAIGEIVSQYFDNSYTRVVSQFIEDEKMNLDELKQLIAQIEQGKNNRKS